MMWQVEELPGAQVRTGGRAKEKVLVAIYERFQDRGSQIFTA
jgi:hypothetical protein